MSIWIPIIITFIANLANIIVAPVILLYDGSASIFIVFAIFLSIVVIGFWTIYFCDCM